MILAGLALSLVLAWLNFLLTTKWAAIPGALSGPRWPWYAAALTAATVFAIAGRRRIGSAANPGRIVPLALAAAGAVTLGMATLSRLPPSSWSQIPLKDDWTELYQQTVNGVRLLHHGTFVGWNWWLQGGYPTSTDIGQNLAALGLLPMTLFGDRIGYHVLHVFVLFALPVLIWWDLREDDRGLAATAAGLACFFTSYYLIGIGNSGDTNSLMGVFCATVALVGSGAARRGHRWGGFVLLLGLTLALYSHPAFFVYAGIFVTIESIYFHDRAVFVRLAVAGAAAAVASLPIHWESLRYHAYTSFNNAVYDPAAPTNWPLALKTMYYNTEILAFPHRWFNDYRSLANVWLPALLVSALRLERSRAGFYVWATLAAQLLLRFNTAEVGAIFDRIQHMLPIVEAPALAAFIIRFAGTRQLMTALAATMAIYVPTTLVPIRHVGDVRDWDPPLIERIGAASSGMTAVEISPHRDMDRDPSRRSPRTPFDVHFEGLLPDATGRRFYSQMIDGWVFNVWRGEVLAAGTWRAEPIDLAPVDVFAGEMQRWGVAHLFVWTDRSRDYLARSGRFVERWRGGLWSDFEMIDPDTRAVVVDHGSGSLRHLNMLGGDVALDGVRSGDLVVVRAHYYPAWQAFDMDRGVPLESREGQLAFRAPRDGSYAVHLVYPRYRALALVAALAFLLGAWSVSRIHPQRGPRDLPAG